MAKALTREQIARRAAQELRDGDYVNLGIGIPGMVTNFIPAGIEVMLHSGNGILGLGPLPTLETFDPDLYAFGTQAATVVPGASFMSTVDALGLARAGKADVSILGAMQVSEVGDLANWMVPGTAPVGMGGAMDVAMGAKRVVVVMEHTTRSGELRLLKRCTFPLTGIRCVHRIITDLCVLHVTPEGLLLCEIARALASRRSRPEPSPGSLSEASSRKWQFNHPLPL